MKWDKIAGVRRELKKMAREAMGREYIFSVTFACMMNLIPWMIHKFLGSHWAVGIISSTIRRCGFAGLSIPLLCFSLRIILRNMLIVLPISIFVQQNMRVGAQDSLYQIFWAEEIRPLDFIRFGFRRYWHNFSGMMMVNIRVFLWSLLFIVPGIIKHYEYWLTPYLLVENPELTPKDAMEFSARLTKGYKWDLFLFDLSFWYWHLLGLLTFGIARVLFVQPYYYLAKSGWHIYLFRMADELSDVDINAYRAQNAERKGKR